MQSLDDQWFNLLFLVLIQQNYLYLNINVYMSKSSLRLYSLRFANAGIAG